MRNLEQFMIEELTTRESRNRKGISTDTPTNATKKSRSIFGNI